MPHPPWLLKSGLAQPGSLAQVQAGSRVYVLRCEPALGERTGPLLWGRGEKEAVRDPATAIENLVGMKIIVAFEIHL